MYMVLSSTTILWNWNKFFEGKIVSVSISRGFRPHPLQVGPHNRHPLLSYRRSPETWRIFRSPTSLGSGFSFPPAPSQKQNFLKPSFTFTRHSILVSNIVAYVWRRKPTRRYTDNFDRRKAIWIWCENPFNGWKLFGLWPLLVNSLNITLVFHLRPHEYIVPLNSNFQKLFEDGQKMKMHSSGAKTEVSKCIL
jgi:hypothetical protein